MNHQQPNFDNLSLFQKLQQELARIIEETPAGERLQSEPELASSLGVSRATLREAMRSFEGQGLIRRRQGVGTFVLDHQQNIETGLEVLESIETQARRIGLDVKMGYLDINKIKSDVELAKKLGINENEEAIRISRVIWVAERPAAFLVDTLIPGILEEKDLSDGFTGSVLDLIIKRGKPELSHSKTEVIASPAPSDIAKKMQIQRGDVLLKLDALLFDKTGRMIDYSQSYFIPGFMKFEVIRSIGK
ncbi:GntR family transcriptional regulator [Flexilinea flocculi]|jgi:GntR family transcriptional regulator|uniref:Transcriptional regulator, GntR family n=1 Tax=Flexilinea flocculi TaxID=1678840 RepID=A0A0K8PBE4_9CHLR|nr:GntR family transcriptional regulator [Flexilinea flocculi]GAP39982.1 transcriptional regulator, GntR family [Flexilinea flocculi]